MTAYSVCHRLAIVLTLNMLLYFTAVSTARIRNTSEIHDLLTLGLDNTTSIFTIVFVKYLCRLTVYLQWLLKITFVHVYEPDICSGWMRAGHLFTVISA